MAEIQKDSGKDTIEELLNSLENYMKTIYLDAHYSDYYLQSRGYREQFKELLIKALQAYGK